MSSVMATESPIRILEGADKLPPFKQSTRYEPSSAKMAFEDLGLFLKGQNFQSLDLDLDVIPSRSGSAPPSMEGSVTAIGSIFSKWKSTLNPTPGYSNISTINSGSTLQVRAEPSSYSAGSSSLSQSVGDPLNSCDSSNPFQPSGDTTCDWQTSSHNSLPVQEEELEEDRSCEQSYSVFVDTAALMSHHNGPLDSTQEDPVVSEAGSHGRHSCSISSSPQNERDSTAVTVDVPNNNLSSSGVSNVDCSSTSGSHIVYKKKQPVSKNKVLLQQAAPQEGNTPRVQGSYSQIICPGTSHTYGSLNRFHYGPSHASAAMVQPLLQSSGFTPPLYAAAALMTSSSPFYPNLHPAGFFPSQYGMGGYTFNSSVSPTYMAGYPPHGAVPVIFNSAFFPTSGVSGGGSVHAYEMQNLHKFYSQIYPFQHCPEHFHLQYTKPSAQDSYGIYGHQTPTDGAILTQVNLRDPKKEAELVSSNNHKHLHSSPAGSRNLNLRRDNVLNHYSYGTGGFPGASVASPNGRYYINHSHSSSGNYKSHGLQNRSSNDTNLHSLLEELKAGKGQRFELSDLLGYISEFSVDQHGSRFVQQRLETCSVEEKASVFKEVIPHASELMNDVFGNYVIQKLFEYGSPEQRKDLADQLEGQILPLSLQMYGCRVIQKALDVIDLEQKERLIRELDGHVTRCVRDQNGNHVIQKCIESIPSQNINFLISSFRCQVATLSMHPYGCRVIQRVLEHCKDESQTQFIVDEILDSFSSLAQDQYGNYVTQYVLERSKPREIRKIIERVSKSIVQLSQHKFASNVVEKCLEYSDSTSRDMLLKEIIGHGDKNDNLWIMMKDQYANYVIQKIIHKCRSNQRELLLGLIRNHLTALKKYTYGKHIVARFEELCGEEIQTTDSSSTHRANTA